MNKFLLSTVDDTNLYPISSLGIPTDTSTCHAKDNIGGTVNFPSDLDNTISNIVITELGLMKRRTTNPYFGYCLLSYIGYCNFFDIYDKTKWRYISINNSDLNIAPKYNIANYKSDLPIGNYDCDQFVVLSSKPGYALDGLKIATWDRITKIAARFSKIDSTSYIDENEWVGDNPNDVVSCAGTSCGCTLNTFPLNNPISGTFITDISFDFTNSQGDLYGLKRISKVKLLDLSQFISKIKTVDILNCCGGIFSSDMASYDACKFKGYLKDNDKCDADVPILCKTNLTHPTCKLYCRNNLNNCAANILPQYCSSIPNIMTTGTEDQKDLCACYMGSSYYQTFYDGLYTKWNINEGILPRIPSCTYPPCAQSTYKQAQACPSISVCFQQAINNVDAKTMTDSDITNSMSCTNTSTTNTINVQPPSTTSTQPSSNSNSSSTPSIESVDNPYDELITKAKTPVGIVVIVCVIILLLFCLSILFS